MEPREEPTPAHDEHLAESISEQVRSVLSAAESAATAIRHEAEQHAQARRRAAEAESARYMEDAKREAAELLQARIRRISELSDSLIEGAEALLMRLDDAHAVRRQLDTMVRALAETAESLAQEQLHELAPKRPAGAAAPAPVAPEPPRPEPAAATVEPETARTEPASEPMSAAPPAEPAPVEEQADADAASEDAARAAAETNGAPASDPEPPVAPGSPAELVEVRGERSSDSDEVLGARLVALQMAVAGGNRGEVEAHLRRAFELEDASGILDDVFGQGTEPDTRVAWPDTAEG